MLGETSDYCRDELNGFKNQSGLTTHYNNDGISFGMGSVALLDMLAEVASQTLQSDPSVKSSPIEGKSSPQDGFTHQSWDLPEKVRPTPEKVTPEKEVIVRKSVKHKKKKAVGIQKLSIKKRKQHSSTQGGKDYRGTNNISNLSANSLINRFSEFDGDEMRRTFSFTCTFDRGHCQQRFSSFGSENKARQHMKDHLLQHVEDRKWEVPSDLPISSKTKTDVEKRQLPYEEGSTVKKKRRKNSMSIPNSCMQVAVCDAVAVETPWMPDVSNTVQHEANNVVEDTLSRSIVAEQYVKEEVNNVLLYETKWMPDVDNIGTEQHAQVEMNNDDSSALIVVKLEDETSVYSEHNYMRAENHFLANMDNIENNVCLRVIKEETVVNEFQPCFENETKTYDGNSMLFKRLKCEDKTTSHHIFGETLHQLVTTFMLNDEEQQFQPLPYIGQEVDVSTSQLPASSALSSLSLETTGFEPSFDVDTDQEGVFVTEGTTSKIKKNKGNSKLLGQSEAEKNLAIQLIESIKYKGSHPDSLECNICSPTRFFTALTTLISHYRSHAGIKPYECRLCGHVFTRQHSLNYHLLIHGNVTRFECADCGRKFRHPSHFKEHRRRHTGEAPYECSDCPLRFKTRNTYKRHLKTRHGKVLTTSGSLISLSDEEFGQVETAARSQSLPKKPTSRGRTKQDGNGAFPSDAPNDGTENGSNNEQRNKSAGDSPSKDELDKENAMANVNNKNVANKNKSLLSANEAFHDIVEEAMRQSDISFLVEPDNISLMPVSKETNNNDDGFDASMNASNNQMVQQNIGANTLLITKIAQNCSVGSSENTFGNMLNVPLLLSNINPKPEKEPVLPDCTSAYNQLLKQSVTVNVTPVLTGNINTLNASYQRNILPRAQPANMRIICPNTPATAIMLVTGQPSAETDG